jgi:hypothetical protein
MIFLNEGAKLQKSVKLCNDEVLNYEFMSSDVWIEREHRQSYPILIFPKILSLQA